MKGCRSIRTTRMSFTSRCSQLVMLPANTEQQRRPLFIDGDGQDYVLDEHKQEMHIQERERSTSICLSLHY